MQIDVKAIVGDAEKDLLFFEKRQLPFATMLALNETAKYLTKKKPSKQGVLGKATGQTFTNKGRKVKAATKHTKTGFFYKQATKTNLTAWVFWDSKLGDYMNFQLFGGTRFPKRRTLVVPTTKSKTYVDRWGNLKQDAVSTLLSDRGKFFTGIPKGAKWPSPGIWERYGRQTKRGKGRRIRMVASFENSETYRPLFPFAELTGKFVFSHNDHAFVPNFRRAIDKALATADRKARRR